MKLSIHLIVYNGEKYLPFCFKSLVKQTFQDFYVLIIDNCSTDGSVDFIENYLNNHKNQLFSEKCRLIKNSKNLGFAPAHNQAIQWSNSEYVFMMNQAQLEEDTEEWMRQVSYTALQLILKLLMIMRLQ